jgi:hypothetical protein
MILSPRADEKVRLGGFWAVLARRVGRVVALPAGVEGRVGSGRPSSAAGRPNPAPRARAGQLTDRREDIPVWAGRAITVPQPLHFVATVVLGSPQVDFAAWSPTAVGMALVARALLRDR